MGPDTYLSRPRGSIRWLVIHHSGVDVDSTAEQIADYHVNVKGWPGIAYHFLVHSTGRIEYVGDLLTTRANVYGLNDLVVGICLPGLFDQHYPSQAQLASTRLLLDELRKELPWTEVVGHGEIALPASPTACPGLTYSNWKGELE